MLDDVLERFRLLSTNHNPVHSTSTRQPLATGLVEESVVEFLDQLYIFLLDRHTFAVDRAEVGVWNTRSATGEDQTLENLLSIILTMRNL